MVFGTFDDLHPGHIYLLSEALKRGDMNVVVARDSNVLKIKGHTPLQNENMRVEAIQKEFPDATVMLGHESDFLTRLREVKPDLILLGYDQQLPPGVAEADLGATIERLDAFEPHIHKSSIRRANR